MFNKSAAGGHARLARLILEIFEAAQSSRKEKGT